MGKNMGSRSLDPEVVFEAAKNKLKSSRIDIDGLEQIIVIHESLYLECVAEKVKHNFEFVNFYCAMAYPGSRLHETAVAEGWPLPEGWEGYSQFGADALPLPTKHLSAGQVLRFRDRAFVEYFADPRYLRMVAEKFGPVAQEHVQEMLKYKMVRKHAAPGQPALR